MSRDNPRIAVLGFAIECNRFSPVSTAHDFETDVDIRGNRIVAEGRAAASITLPDLPGFFTEMDRTGPWTPVPIRVSQAQPGGPVEKDFFRAFLTEIASGLRAALPVDGVFVSCHGAALAEGSDDPDGDLFEIIRGIVGPDVPVVSTFDLHANVSRRMTDNLSVFVGYLENPHTDIRERGIESAKHLRECLAGARTAVTMVKLPLVPPQISLLTARGPYADLIKYGQTQVGGDIMNVSVMAGFAYADSPKNGLTAVVTARNGNRAAAAALSLDIAQRAWAMKERFKRGMMAMADAVQLAVSVGRDRRRKPIILADVADLVVRKHVRGTGRARTGPGADDAAHREYAEHLGRREVLLEEIRRAHREEARDVRRGHARFERIEQRVVRYARSIADGLGFFALEGHDFFEPRLKLRKARLFARGDPGLLRQRAGVRQFLDEPAGQLGGPIIIPADFPDVGSDGRVRRAGQFGAFHLRNQVANVRRGGPFMAHPGQ